MPICSACGREWTAEEVRVTGRSGGVHFGVLHCPDCTLKWNALVTGFETLYLEAKIYGKPIPNIDRYLAENASVVGELKVPVEMVKWHLLHRCWTTYEVR